VRKISKKVKIYSIVILLFLVVLEIAAVASNDLFFEKVSAQEVAKRNMPANSANAVKHAYAASLVYSGFRKIFFSEKLAKEATIFLGKVNEIAEVIFKPNQDSSLEMMKDLQNNLAGIYAAKFLETDGKNLNRMNFIGDLAEKKILVLSRDDMNLEQEKKSEMRKTFKYKLARNWFDENLSELEKDIEMKIQTIELE
jgi:hypothetical protein